MGKEDQKKWFSSLHEKIHTLMGSSGNSLFYNKAVKMTFISMGSRLKTFPEALRLGPAIYLKLSFPSSLFVYPKTKNFKQNGISIKQPEKHRLEPMNAFLFIVKARQQHGPSLESIAIALSQDPTGFPWQKWREEWLWWGNVSPSVRVFTGSWSSTECLCACMYSTRMHIFEQAVFEKLFLSWILTICLSVFSDVCMAVGKNADTNLSTYTSQVSSNFYIQ